MALTIISMPTRPGPAGAHQGSVTDREARQAARLAGLDYRLSGRSGTLRLPAGVRVRLASDRPTDAGHQTDRKPDRSGPVYVVGIGDQRFDKPVLHRKWRKLMADRE
ncbi:MAG: hypothetical protein IH960_03550 [Chloroflexi bacterium]|nr:hypothetical protein [Chloroflexota bacterium]